MHKKEEKIEKLEKLESETPLIGLFNKTLVKEKPYLTNKK